LPCFSLASLSLSLSSVAVELEEAHDEAPNAAATGVARSLLQTSTCSPNDLPALTNCLSCRTTRTAAGVVRLCKKCSGKQFKLVGGACGEWVVGRW
jgi:hypothetical protein